MVQVAGGRLRHQLKLGGVMWILLMVSAAVLVLAVFWTAVAFLTITTLRRVPNPQWSATYQDLLIMTYASSLIRVVAKMVPPRQPDDPGWSPQPGSRQARLQHRLGELGELVRRSQAQQ